MIIGVFLRNFKTYSGINYIPLTSGHSFCGLVGDNGIGKSSVLEALDCLFNKKDWNYNIKVRKSGLETAKPHIVPVYLLHYNQVSSEHIELFKKISDYTWNIEINDISPPNYTHFQIFSKQRDFIKNNYNDTENLILIPLGLSFNEIPNLSIFNTKKIVETIIDNNQEEKTQLSEQDLDEKLSPLHKEITELFEYIYIPKDIDPEQFTQLENREIQSLMGENLNEIVEKCVPQQQIKKINYNLNSFIDSLSELLGDYAFKNPGQRRINLKKNDVYKLIIDAYFKIRKLHKKEGNNWLELNDLSSGEKQKAIIELAYQLLSQYRSKTDNLIIAIDEPESSLHMSACHDQFNKLFNISTLCSQLLFATHWYGFIPTVENGYVSVITKKSNQHNFDLIDISRYRESIKQTVRESKGKLPYDVKLKSLNDFIQSIITSILSDNPYNWIICEGSSEKIYFEQYFADIKQNKKLRIIPVGGAKEIKRIYEHLKIVYEDLKNEIQGKIILISDTDSELVKYSTQEFNHLKCYRIVNDEVKKQTILVAIDSNPVSPETEIEDSLNGKLFFETLKDFQNEYPDLSRIIQKRNDKDMIKPEKESYFYLDLSLSEKEILDDFFNQSNNKVRFAKQYVTKINHEYKTPEWINKIRKELLDYK